MPATAEAFKPGRSHCRNGVEDAHRRQIHFSLKAQRLENKNEGTGRTIAILLRASSHLEQTGLSSKQPLGQMKLAGESTSEDKNR
jgi:hypothetical protein